MKWHVVFSVLAVSGFGTFAIHVVRVHSKSSDKSPLMFTGPGGDERFKKAMDHADVVNASVERLTRECASQGGVPVTTFEKNVVCLHRDAVHSYTRTP